MCVDIDSCLCPDTYDLIYDNMKMGKSLKRKTNSKKLVKWCIKTMHHIMYADIHVFHQLVTKQSRIKTVSQDATTLRMVPTHDG